MLPTVLYLSVPKGNMKKRLNAYVAVFGEEKMNNAVTATRRRVSPSLTSRDRQHLGKVAQWSKG